MAGNMDKKIENVILVLHERTMATDTCADELTMARLRKAAIPGILEFFRDELQNGNRPSEVIAFVLIFFGEFLARIALTYSAAPSETTWLMMAESMKLMFDETSAQMAQMEANEETQA